MLLRRCALAVFLLLYEPSLLSLRFLFAVELLLLHSLLNGFENDVIALQLEPWWQLDIQQSGLVGVSIDAHVIVFILASLKCWQSQLLHGLLPLGLHW